ncbi:MAG: hypothetical protein ABR865_14810 [Terracidiphilus sp.]|jgi:hypothetical protein
MKGKAKQSAGKPGGGTLLVAFAAVLFVLILLLRMLVFVTPHGRHPF